MKTFARQQTIEAIWGNVDNSMDGYRDLIDMCLRRLTGEQLEEIATSLRGGLTTEAKLIQESYPNAECPDCSEEIPDYIVAGGECKNCGHVFHLPDSDWEYPNDV